MRKYAYYAHEIHTGRTVCSVCGYEKKPEDPSEYGSRCPNCNALITGTSDTIEPPKQEGKNHAV